MNVISNAGQTEMVVVGMEPGEMLLESIEQAVADENIRNGVVVSGIGTLKNLHMHFITHTNFPSDNEFINIERPLELVSVSGIIADGEVHLHVSVSCGRDDVHCGHLEAGCEVAYLAEVAILKCNDLAMVRRPDEKRKIKLIGPK